MLMMPPSALNHGVVTGAIAQWSGLPKPRNRRVDQPRVLRAQIRVAQSHVVERAWTKILDEHIGACDEVVEQLAAAGVLEIQRHAFLVPVDAQEIRALALGKRRPPRACIVAGARPLNLDHASAHVGELHRAIGPCEDATEIQDSDTLEGAGGIWGMIHGVLVCGCASREMTIRSAKGGHYAGRKGPRRGNGLRRDNDLSRSAYTG